MSNDKEITDGCWHEIHIEIGYIRGAYGVFMETEAVVDDSDDRGAHSVWPSSHLYSRLCCCSFHLHPVLNRGYWILFAYSF